jgi:hypothetical protein
VVSRRPGSVGARPTILFPALLSVAALLTGCGGGSSSSSGSHSPSSCPSPKSDAYARAVLADKPAVYYRLDDADGQTLCDASASHNDGAYSTTGVKHRQPGALHGVSDTAVTADGTAQVATSSAGTGISGSVSFTLEGWFQTTTKQDQMVVAIGQPGAQTMAGIGPWSNHVSSTFVVTQGTGDYVSFDTYDGTFEFDASSSGIDVFDGHWHYIALSFNGGSGVATAYLDKHTLGSQGVPDRPSPSPVRIGYWVDTIYNKPFSGGLDEIAVYPSALTAEQVARHYAAA